VESYVNPLLASGEITAQYYVEDLLETTLAKAGLPLDQIQRTVHYTDCSLVAIFAPGSPYLLYNDADVFLEAPCDWISPSVKLMEEDERIAVANPDWHHSSLATEAREYKDGFGIGYGFSDQLYLIRRSEFARPIYGHTACISWRYPFSHIAPIFEQRVDAYMRCRRRMRATYRGATYLHTAEEGSTYKVVSVWTRLKRSLMLTAMKLLSSLPGDDPRFHI
jgi:hypothetical protein